MMPTDAAISLREVTEENWYDCCQLSVTEEQEQFVEANAISLVQSKYEPTLLPKAIYRGHDLVGLLMYNTEPERLDGQWSHWIYRLMVDKLHQRMGIARHALRLLLDEMATIPKCKRIMVGYHPGNMAAGALYASIGFEDHGDRFGKEKAVVLELPTNP